jgi:hypothetical protein
MNHFETAGTPTHLAETGDACADLELCLLLSREMKKP